jgi:hypothetical protein
MKKLTRLEIFTGSMATAGSVSLALTAFFANLNDSDIGWIRTRIAEVLPDGLPFVLVGFVLTLMVAYGARLSFYYNVVPKTGSIFSKDGVLLFDREQHIAISVATLKSIFVTLSAETERGRANELLYRAGEAAGKRFGDAFKDIYITQVEPHGYKPWGQLSDNDKLDAWERYDATVGWGRISANKFDKRSTVEVIFRHPTLYDGHGGELFSWILAGYSKEVAGALLGRTLQFDRSEGFVRDSGVLRLHFGY